MPFQIDITITNPDGQRATASAAFEFVAAPQITSVSPASGPATGGTEVVIAGSGFQAGATVQFGDVPAAKAVVNADGTSITVTSPAV